MTSTPEETVKRMAEEIEKSSSSLHGLNVKLRGYYDRLEVIYKQYRRRVPVKDLSFQEEFRAAVLELKTLADESNDFWQGVRAYFRSLNKAELAANSRMNVKQMNISALAFNRQVDELYTVVKNIQTLAKDVPMRLNWWLLEASCEDLTKITSRVLFLIRDMEKYL
ncbi:hypothetical protein [Candidatus Proelusimicrobium excrementi]|uniref:hypothetical protein n=1 Tax=Candidatus Proelusimicrobium excrementi TaxID=3416222 RepID=UPI003D128C22